MERVKDHKDEAESHYCAPPPPSPGQRTGAEDKDRGKEEKGVSSMKGDGSGAACPGATDDPGQGSACFMRPKKSNRELLIVILSSCGATELHNPSQCKLP